MPPDVGADASDIIENNPGRVRLGRWAAHLAGRGVAVPELEDFLSFGRLSTLERLLPNLAASAPAQCGPLRAAIQSLRAEKRARAGSKATGRRPGKQLSVSVERADLPPSWLGPLDEMTAARRHLDAGGIHFDGKKPPAMSSIKGMTYVLRCLAFSCRRQGIEPELRKRAVRAWIDDAEARGCGDRGLALQIGLLRRFVIRVDGKKSKLAGPLASLRLDYAVRGKIGMKRKEKFLLAHPTTIGEIWEKAEALLADAALKPVGSATRQKLLREASALALGVAVPLRIGDLHRFRVGIHLTRSTAVWSLTTDIRKTGGDYDRGDLWPELTPFLDALIEVDAPGGDLWTGYDARQGMPLFTEDFGATGLSGDWISDVWQEHVGCGAHIIRTLWHQICWDQDDDSTWVALALCGQAAPRTAEHYTVKGQRRRALTDGRRLIQAARRASLMSA
jgi:hypothetical protein